MRGNLSSVIYLCPGYLSLSLDRIINNEILRGETSRKKSCWLHHASFYSSKGSFKIVSIEIRFTENPFNVDHVDPIVKHKLSFFNVCTQDA